MTRSDIARQYSILKLLPADSKIRRSGRGWGATCPFHEDRSPSLYVSQGDDGRWLWYCNAGCGGGTAVDFYARMFDCSPGAAIRDLAGPVTPSRVAAVARERSVAKKAMDAKYGRELVFVCNACGLENEPFRLGRVHAHDRAEFLESIGWSIFPNRGPDLGRAVFCRDHAYEALRYACLVTEDGGLHERLAVARAS